MGIDLQLVQYANSVNFPSSYLIVGPIALALALHIIRAKANRPKIYEDGKWVGAPSGGETSSVASLLALILIVFTLQFTHGAALAKDFNEKIQSRISFK